MRKKKVAWRASGNANPFGGRSFTPHKGPNWRSIFGNDSPVRVIDHSHPTTIKKK